MATITKSRTARHRVEGTPFDKALKELSPELRSKILSVLHKIDKIKCISCPKKRNELAAEFKNAVVEICRAKNTVTLNSFCTFVETLAKDAKQSQEGVVSAFRQIKKEIMGGAVIGAFDKLKDFEGGHVNGNGMGKLPLTDKNMGSLKEQQSVAD